MTDRLKELYQQWCNEEDGLDMSDCHEALTLLFPALEDAQKINRIAAGYISATPRFSSYHPEQVLDWLKQQALKEIEQDAQGQEG